MRRALPAGFLHACDAPRLTEEERRFVPRLHRPMLGATLSRVAVQLLLLCLCANLPAVGDVPSSDGPRLAPELALLLQTAGSRDMIPFTVILREQPNARRLRIEADRLRLNGERAAGRALAIGAMRSLARETQGDLLSVLESARQSGRVRMWRSHWIANAIVGVATPQVIREIAARPEVTRVLWDPPVAAEIASDEYVPPGGRRTVAPPTLSDRDPIIGWNLVMIGAPSAWSGGHRGQGVVVALIDTGVDYNHTDFSGRIWVNEDEIAGNGIDDDANGFIDDTRGWDFVSGDNDPMGDGPTDHGTRAAGLVAGDGASGIATGVAPEAQIMPIRASGGPWSNIYAGLEYACDNGADVISMSVTQKWRFEPKPDYGLWRQITDDVLAAGVFHANSIGNEGDNQSTDPIPFNISAPGCSPAPWIPSDQYVAGGFSSVTGAGCVDSLGYLSDFSGRGPFAWEEISAVWPIYPFPVPAEYQDYPYSNGMRGLIKPDVLAPGEEVTSTKLGGGYMTISGTSAACPHIAGMMAILLEARPTLTPSQMALVLQLSAHGQGPLGKDNDYGAGLVSVVAALQMANTLDAYVTITGAVTDSVSGDSLSGAIVKMLEPGKTDTTNVAGEYGLMVHAGLGSLRVSRFGYYPDTLDLVMAPGEQLDICVPLAPWPAGRLAGTAWDATSGQPVAGVMLGVPGAPLAADTTGPDGTFEFATFPADTNLTLRAIRFGYAVADSHITVAASDTTELDFMLTRSIHDDFEVVQGWSTSDPHDTALDGYWVRCDPTGIIDEDVPVQPEDDHTPDPGFHCYVTGNGVPGCGEYQNDVDGGVTTLTSPLFDGTWFFEAELTLWWWYSNDSGAYVDDTLRIETTSDNGASWIPLMVTTESNHAWEELRILLRDVITVSDSMRVRVRASDTRRESALEVAIDDFTVESSAWAHAADGGTSARTVFLGPRQNPMLPNRCLAFDLAQAERVRLEIFDVAGRRVRALARGSFEPGLHLLPWDGCDEGGRPCPAGTYFARLTAGQTPQVERIVLLR